MLQGPAEEHASDLAFVQASVYRSSVIATLRDWPKTSSQVASACSISLSHASRTIHELLNRILLVSMTPDLRGRGRLYGLTPKGERVSLALEWQNRRPVMVPMARATHAYAAFRALVPRVGERRARTLFEVESVSDTLDQPANKWMPLRSLLRLLEGIERSFGDGSYSFIRDLAADAIGHFSSARHYLLRALPLKVIVEFAASTYLREFNHGRMETDIEGHAVHFKQYDWLSSPARCAAWLGTYQGSFRIKKVKAEVVKQECILRGDEFCGYRATWEE